MKKVLYSEFDVDDTVTLIHGDAKGADRLSEIALKGYFHGGFEVLRFPADWDKHGKAAGPIRNKQMLDEGKPDLVIAFLSKVAKQEILYGLSDSQHSRGTKNMIEQAEKADVPVKIVEIE